jgi:hypothetical protein
LLIGFDDGISSKFSQLLMFDTANVANSFLLIWIGAVDRLLGFLARDCNAVCLSSV